MNDHAPRVKLGGLWAKHMKNGQVFFSGDFGAYGQITIWPNQKRPDKNDPDFNMYISEKPKKAIPPAFDINSYLNPSSPSQEMPPYPPMNPRSSQQPMAMRPPAYDDGPAASFDLPF